MESTKFKNPETKHRKPRNLERGRTVKQNEVHTIGSEKDRNHLISQRTKEVVPKKFFKVQCVNEFY